MMSFNFLYTFALDVYKLEFKKSVSIILSEVFGSH